MQDKQPNSASARVGIDYAIKLSYTAVDKSDRADKRDLIYSLLCFGCMFDEAFAAQPDPVVKKYGCLSAPEPQKMDLYALAHTIVSLEMPADRQKEVRANWYMLFAYVLLSGAPHDEQLYDDLCERLQTPEVFAAVLSSRYSVYIPATAEEAQAQGAPSLLAAWYAPYQRYCCERDEKGVTRETAECKRLLALGKFDDVLLRCERLLAAFPDDEQIALTDIAARVSLSGATDSKSRTALLKDTLSLIDDYADISDNVYFTYFRGLTLLGLMDTVGARNAFTACLQQDASFESAALMLKGMDAYEK
ncbi:MAG: hypothetical protein HFE46_02670 [Clostridia bacterium]|nr:hypothetical protein [Clostridia bacterium]